MAKYEIEYNDQTSTANELTSDQIIFGQLSSSDDDDIFYVDVLAGNTIAIDFDSPLNTTSYYYSLALVNPDGTVVASKTTGQDTSLGITAESDGRFYFEIRSDVWHTDDQYGISLRDDLLYERESSDNLSPNRLEHGQTIYGQILTRSDDDFFSINAESGDSITIAFDSPRDTPTSLFELNLISPDGETIASNHTGSDILLGAVAPSDGEYLLEVSADHFSHTDERYSVSMFLNELAYETENNDEESNADNLVSGQTIYGQLLTGTDDDFFSINAESGDSISVDFDSPTSSSSPYFELYLISPDGEILASNDTGSDVSFGTMAPVSGDYFVKVSAYHTVVKNYLTGSSSIWTDHNDDQYGLTFTNLTDNKPPVITLVNSEFWSYVDSVDEAITISLDDVFVYEDADDDPLTYIAVKVVTDEEQYFTYSLDSETLVANEWFYIPYDRLSDLTYSTPSIEQDDTILVSAYDGTDWSNTVEVVHSTIKPNTLQEESDFKYFKSLVVVIDDFSTWAMEDQLIASMTTIYDYAEVNYIHPSLGVIDTAYPGYINITEYGLENVNVGGVDLLKSTGAYERSESSTPNHGDWVLKTLCESLDNPNDVEIIALDCDFTTFQDMTYLFTDNNYENAYLSAFDDVIEEDTFYFMAGLSTSFGGEDISEFLPTISSILSNDSLVVQASPNVSQHGTNWGNVFPNVINVGAWNIDEDGYFLGSDPSQTESIDLYADGFVESSNLGWGSNFGTSFAAPKVMGEILNLYDELVLADLNFGNETYDASAQVDLTSDEETLITNWFVDEISSEYILSGPSFVSSPVAVLNSTIDRSGAEPSIIEGYTFGSGQLITHVYSSDIALVDISKFNTESWATESESLAIVVGTDAIDQFDISNELTNQQTHASVFVGDGDDTVTDSIGDDFVMFGDGADTLNTSSGADLIYKAGSGSLTINADPDGVWGHGYYAKNVGLANSIGTENLISLAGFNRFHDTLALGDGQIDVTVNASLPNDATTGCAVFTEDVFSPRHADVNPITQFFMDSDIEISAGLRSFSSVSPQSGASFTINGSEFGDLFDFTTEIATALPRIDGYQINYFGHGGDDLIWGSAHANIDGGEGDDIINGGYGDNTLTGGSGSDIFEFTATSGNDTITDFNKDEDQLHFYYRKGEDEESSVASIDNGVVTWDAVTVDLGDSSLALSDLNITYEMV